MPVVKMPDGQLVDMPDNPTPQQQAALRAILSKGATATAVPAKEGPSLLGETARVLDKSVRGGLLSLPGLIGDAAVGGPNWIARKTGLVEDTPANTPGPEGYMAWPSDALATITGGKIAEPETATGKVAGNVGAAVTSALTGTPGVASLKTAATQLPMPAKIGLGAGLGAEGAGAVFEDNPIAKFLGGLAGGFGTAGVSLYRADNVDKVARKVFEGISRSEVLDALQTQKDSAKAGLPLTLSQAMGRETNLDALVAGLANSSEGVNTLNTLRAQPLDIRLGMEVAAGQLPGKVRATQDLANRSQEVATKLIDEAKRFRTDSWQRAFDDELTKLQTNPIASLDQAIKLASKHADELAAAKMVDQIALTKARELDASNLAAQQQARKALEDALSEPAPIPSGVGAIQGRLLTDSQRGAVSDNLLHSWEARQAQLLGQGTIVGADGRPLQTAPSIPEVILQEPSIKLQAPKAAAALKDAEKEVTAARARLAATTEVPQQAVQKVYQRLTNLAEQAGPRTAKQNLLLDLRNRLVTDEGYLTNASQLNEVLKDFTNGLKPVNLATKGIDAGTAKWVGAQVGGIRDSLGQAFTPFQKANQAFQANTPAVDELKKSFVGALAGKSGALVDVNAPQGKLLRLFDQGTQPKATRSEILTTLRQLNKQDPELVLDAGKTWITTKLDQALNSPGARDAPMIAKAMVHAFGSPQKTSAQTQGLSDVLAGMAEAQKLPPEALQGLPKFLNYVAMAVDRPSTTAGVTASEIAGMEAESAVGRIGHVSKLTWLRQPILAYTARLSSNTRAEVDRLLSSPEGIQMLYELSRTSPWTEPGQRAITAFIAGTAKPPEENLPGITAE